LRILLAPDKFKEALSAEQVCAALAVGLRQVLPDAEVVTCPLADGGEGTGPVLARLTGATPRERTVLDPLARPRSACWWLTADARTAIVEMAQASGLFLLSPHERHAPSATSYGTGQLIAAALQAGASQILVCVGGSATVDGGAGCLQALGWELFDARERPIAAPATGAMLGRIARLRAPAATPAAEIHVLCDVDNPLLGPRGAAAVFAPQKGATPQEVRELEAGLRHWAGLLYRTTGRQVANLPGAGAAGGLPAALAAALQAQLRRGFEVVAEYAALDAKLRECDLCLTGEGRLDEQTLGGKVVAGVAQHAAALGVPVVAFVGAVAADKNKLSVQLGLTEIVVITPPDTPLTQALADTAQNLQRAAAAYIRTHRLKL
jgi:glycerate kinase